MDLEIRKDEKVHVTKDDIKGGLRKLGLREGDVVGVHSSLSSFGYVEGGADVVIDALLETVGEEGAIVMPTYSTNREDVERTPEEVKLGVTWKSRILPYDPKTTPCWTGKIPDTFRRRKTAVRGSNPTHSLAAIGRRADELVQGWKKLLESNGYILLLGVDLSCCSSMHLAEERVQLPHHILEKSEPPQELIDKYGANLGWPEWDIGYGPYPNFAKMEVPCKEGRIMRIIGIGESTVRLVRLRYLIELYAEALRENPDIFYS